jgi:peroxiredoxin
MDEHNSTTEILCDSDHSVAVAYGAAESADQEKPGRLSVLIGRDGKVIKNYQDPDVPTHAETVLGDL